jgi:carbonic anhydrase/acetyltransferase-like protein (isoleucine patch superfamily)
VFVAPTALVLGDVVLGEETSVWYGAVVRGDVGPIRVGARTNLQDGCVLHVTTGLPGLTVGDEVTVGHRAVLHGATIADRCLVGMGAILLDGCTVGEESLIGAGSVVREGTIVPPRSFAAGIPAGGKGPITPPVHAPLRESAAANVALSPDHAALHHGSR